MRGKGQCTPTVLLIGALVVGLGSVAMQLYAPSPIVNSAENHIEETQATTKAKTLQNHLEDHYLESAMNLSMYQSTYMEGATTSNFDQWNESNMLSLGGYRARLEKAADSRFYYDYFPGAEIPENCRFLNPLEGEDDVEPEDHFNFRITDMYAENGDEEGLNFSAKPVKPVRVKCSSPSSWTVIGMSDEIENRFHNLRYFRMYNLTRHLTTNDSFRFRVEGAAINVSNYLQIETYHNSTSWTNCEPESYGDGTNSQDPPYNNGTDCPVGNETFNETNLEDHLINVQNKYENRTFRPLNRSLSEYVDKWEDPSYWVPEEWDEERYGDFEIDVRVAGIEYNITPNETYRDRKVVACKNSHESTFYVGACSDSATVTGESCGCGLTCPDQCSTNEDCDSCSKDCTEKCDELAPNGKDLNLINNCAATDCGVLSSHVTFSPSCGDEEEGCECPDYFPVNTQPELSVNDSEKELEGYPVADEVKSDCPGEKTSEGYQGDKCELDDACQVNNSGYRVEADTAAGDAKVWDDEHGVFRKCENDEDLYDDVDNPWYYKTNKDYAEDTGSWRNSGLEDIDWGKKFFIWRYFEGDYPIEVIGKNPSSPIGYVGFDEEQAPSVLPLREGPLRAQEGEEDDDDEDDCPVDCSPSDSCKYKFSSSCDITASESSYTDFARENEVVKATAEYRFDLKAVVRLSITVTDKRYRVPSSIGMVHPTFNIGYTQAAVSTADFEGRDRFECEKSDPINPDG